ncbi:MAG: aspartate 1-decarboxylase [Sedimentisphaerales bacterium]|nr:aspartate 1-decarboxylase [Sedimentisphaerales bacterium]
MRLRLLKSKIHRATVTETKLHYSGSIAIDRDLMDAAGIVPYEQVLIADVTNGTRHETYVVPAERGSGTISVMGAAAHLAQTDDIIIIMAFADVEADQVGQHKPKIIVVDENNRPIK